MAAAFSGGSGVAREVLTEHSAWLSSQFGGEGHVTFRLLLLPPPYSRRMTQPGIFVTAVCVCDGVGLRTSLYHLTTITGCGVTYTFGGHFGLLF